MGFQLGPFIEGFFTGFGLLMAIGPQGAFVLRQGILKKHVFIVPLFCSLSDVLLIGLGVAGLGEVLTDNKVLLAIAKWGGSAFLFYYGFSSFKRLFRSENSKFNLPEENVSDSLKKTLILLFALTFLNPIVYLDTVVLIGSIGSQFVAMKKLFFAIGAMMAAFVWFFSLSYGARLLSPLFQNPKIQKGIDGITGCIMWIVAIAIFRS